MRRAKDRKLEIFHIQNWYQNGIKNLNTQNG